MNLEANKTQNSNYRKCVISPDRASNEKYLVIKQKQSDLKPARCSDFIREVESSLTNTIQCLDERFQSFEKYVDCSLNDIQNVLSQNKGEEELARCVQEVRGDLERLEEAVVQLQRNKECQDLQNEVLCEKIHVLSTVKADKEAVEDALADKASICELNKKVSHELFNAACEELSRTMDETVAKLSQVECTCQQSICKLRCEFDEKLENLGIPAFKDSVSNELLAIRNQLKVLSEVKREQEAAAGRKILRNLRCISCDKDAFMQTNSKSPVGSEPFPCRASTKPYLTFRMDQVRKQQKPAYQAGKNVNHLEKVVKESNETRDDGDACSCTGTCENVTKDQFCNRYCGGSHTILRDQQRKINKPKGCANPLQEYDPAKMVEGFVQGTDGQLYRGRWVKKEC